MSNDKYNPRPEHKFSFGLWTLGNRGRDPFGEAVRPAISPNDIVAILGELGAWGVNLYDPVFRDGAFTANDPSVRAYALQKTMTAMDLGAELGAKIFVLWGGREGTETDSCRRPDHAVKRLRDALNYLCEYNLDKKYGFKFAMEAKPNEPRGDIYMATTGAYLGFIPTLAHPEMVGVNPEVAHEHMAGLNALHAVAQAWECGKLFHIDLNDQNPGRYDQDFRFGSATPKAMFWLVKFLEDVGYAGPRHFDAHAYRTEDIQGVKDFALGCMRTYVILKEKARQWNEDPEIQAIVKELNAGNASSFGNYSTAAAQKLLATSFDRRALAQKGLQYERLDQLTIELLMGVR
jgi:xylose isomerase